MTDYRIVITDVTEFGDRFCVAGWDLLSSRMVRPEPPDTVANSVAARFWTEQHCGIGKVFDLGNVVTCQGVNAPPGFPYPHATEDIVLNANSTITVVSKCTHESMVAQVAASVSAALPDVYDGGLIRPASGKAYVSKDHPGRSLGAVEINPASLQFHVNTYNPEKPKLRARITVAGSNYDLPVTALAAHKRWREDGLQALVNDAANAQRVHLRMGLSRPFAARPDECFSQINGVIFAGL